MAWQCRIIQLKEGEHAPNPETRQPGDMWYWENKKTVEEYREMGIFSEDYLNTWFEYRPPICVILPSNQIWNVDLKSSGGGPGWQVRGNPPFLTATPSIMTDKYHGFLQNGVLTDDLDGRQYKL